MDTENKSVSGQTSVYSRGFRGLLKCIRFFRPRWRMEREPDPAQGPYLFVSRHLDNFGPVALFLQMPVEYRLWVLACLIKKDENYAHLSGYTFSKRMGYPLWLSRLLAWLICGSAQWLFRSIDAIPVYRGSREAVATVRCTLQALGRGQNVLVLTDRDYTSRAEDVGELCSGFVYIARQYFRTTGRDLPLVPVLPDKEGRALRFSKPLFYHEEAGYAKEKQRLLGEFARALSFGAADGRAASSAKEMD